MPPTTSGQWSDQLLAVRMTLTSIGNFGGDLEEQMALNVSLSGVDVLHGAVGVSTSDLRGGGHLSGYD